MASLLRNFNPRQSSFTANVLTLVSGTALAQGLVIAASPILTRLYLPEDFGIFALFLSIVNTLSVMATLRYELAILLPENDSDAVHVLALCVVIAAVVGSLCLLGVGLFRNQMAALLGAPELSSWLWLVPLSIFLAGIFQGLIFWFTRRKRFRDQASAKVGQSVGRLGTQIGSALAAPVGSGGLVAGYLVGQFLGNGILGGRFWREERGQMGVIFSARAIQEQAARYKKFPLLTTLSGVANTLAHQIPIWFIAAFYGPQMAGFYSLAYRTIYLPSSLVGSAVSQVFFERATQEKNLSGSSLKATKRVFSMLAIISLLPFASLMIWGPQLFSLIFGEAWRTAGQLTALLVPIYWISFIASPLSLVTAVHERQEILFFWQVGLACICIFSLWGAYHYFKTIFAVLKVLSFSVFFWYIIYLFLIFKVSRGKNI